MTVFHDPAAAPARQVRRAAGVAPRAVGVVTNLKSRRNQARTGVPRIVSPGVLEASPTSHAELSETLAVFARRRVELLVIDGGDGTVRDVLSAAPSVFGGHMPAIAVVPAGKTNALAIDLGIPDDWSVQRAIEAAAAGNLLMKSPLEVTRLGAGGGDPVHRGFLLGMAGFVRATTLAQRAHGWGAFNGLAVGLSLGMVVAQTLFGGRDNPWQRGEQLRIETADGDVQERRFYLALASTLERLPLGVAPFGRPRPGLKLLSVDAPVKNLGASVVPLLAGSEKAALARRGYRRLDSDWFDVTLEGEFVLDGETYPGGALRIATGTPLRFVVP